MDDIVNFIPVGNAQLMDEVDDPSSCAGCISKNPFNNDVIETKEELSYDDLYTLEYFISYSMG